MLSSSLSQLLERARTRFGLEVEVLDSTLQHVYPDSTTALSRMIEESPGITRLIDRLEAKGWVRRERCPHDRRQVLCWITPAGLGVLESLDEPMAEADDRALSMLSTEDKSHLIRLLDAIRAGSR